MSGEGSRRRVALHGAVNFRDLGGYPVAGHRHTRWRRLYRSDSLADLTDADHATLERLGLHTLIDFRMALERARKPNRLPPGMSLRTVELGFMPDGALDMIRRVLSRQIDAEGVERETLRHYRLLPTAHRHEYTQMFHRIGDAAGRPILIHCASGKDRTGFGAAMILSALGADRETVLEDYALTNRHRRDLSFLLSRAASPAVVNMLMAAQPKYMETALDAIDRQFGSIDTYLSAALGLTDAKRERLQAWLTEP